MSNRRFVFIVLVLAMAAIGTLALQSRLRSKAAPVGALLTLPDAIGDYQGQDVELQERVYDILRTRNVIMREYAKTGEPPILFYLIFDRESQKSSDPPENCIQGSGKTVTAKKKITLAVPLGDQSISFVANKLSVLAGGRHEVYVYWFLAGGEMLDNYLAQRVKLVKSYLLGRPLSGGQVRISTDVVEGDEEEAMIRLQEFIRMLLPHLLPIIRS